MSVRVIRTVRLCGTLLSKSRGPSGTYMISYPVDTGIECLGTKVQLK